MCAARRRDRWDHTAALLALLANVHRDPKKRKRPFSAVDFHPLPDRRGTGQKQATVRLGVEVFKVFLPGEGK